MSSLLPEPLRIAEVILEAIEVTTYGDSRKKYIPVTHTEPSIQALVRQHGGEIVTAEVLAYAIHAMCPDYLEHPVNAHVPWANQLMDIIRQTTA